MTITFRTTASDRRSSVTTGARRSDRRGMGSLRLRIDLCLADVEGGDRSIPSGHGTDHEGRAGTADEFSPAHWSTRVSA